MWKMSPIRCVLSPQNTPPDIHPHRADNQKWMMEGGLFLKNKDDELVKKYTRVSMPPADEPDPMTSPPAHQAEPGKDVPYSTIKEKPGAAVTLDFRLKTGDSENFPYSYLVRMRFDKSGIITLKFSDTKVTITGRNLLGLYDALGAHKVTWIQEGDDRYDERSESEPFISAIKIENGI